MTAIRWLHLVRHAESRWNVERRYQGHGDSGLTPTGIAQAERLAGWLVEHLGRPSRIVSSDLPRALATAAPYAARVGADVALDPRFREVDIGTWSGRSFTEVADEEPELVAALAAGGDLPRGGGETFAVTRLRVGAALEAFARTDGAAGSAVGAAANNDDSDNNGDRTTVVFTHGGPIRVAVAEAIDAPTPGHSRLRPPTNCSISTFELVGGRWQLLHYNRPTVVSDSREPTE